MAKLLMVTGLGSAKDLASGKKGAFYNTLEEFHKYWERIDVISPKIGGYSGVVEVFGNVYVHISPWPLLFHPLWFLKKGFEIYKEHKFDLMTVHEFPPFYNGIGARLLWQKIKVPYILEIFHIPGFPRPATFKEELYKQLMKIFIAFDSSKARAVRIMNGQVGGFLKEFGVPANKIILIPAIYADLDVFKPFDPVKVYDLIFIGRLESNKGIDLFLETVRKLNCRALIVGSGSLFEKIKLEIQNSKLDIDLHGWAKNQAEVAGLLNQSRILVMPSYNEGGPRVVVEALACGVPVLATSVGIVPDLLKNSNLGKIIDWDVEDIVKKAEEILKNYDNYKNTGLETVKQFEKKSAIKNYADKLKDIVSI